MRAAPLRPEFPSGDVLARAFFEEGIRHLEDGRLLHQAGRYPAAIASAMKAAEFGVKAVIVLDGALGWWDKVFTTHSPLSDIDSKNLPFFQPHVTALTGYSGTLVTDVKIMEKLSPAKPGGSYDVEAQQNPEYPFVSYHLDLSTGDGAFRLSKPSTHFVEADSKKYYNIAQDLLTAVTTQYTTIGGWSFVLPTAL